MRKEFDRVELAFVTDVLKAAPAIYARHFTVDELNELIDILPHRVGAKALHEMPQVMGEFTATLVPRLQDMQARSVGSVRQDSARARLQEVTRAAAATAAQTNSQSPLNQL